MDVQQSIEIHANVLIGIRIYPEAIRPSKPWGLNISRGLGFGNEGVEIIGPREKKGRRSELFALQPSRTLQFK